MPTRRLAPLRAVYERSALAAAIDAGTIRATVAGTRRIVLRAVREGQDSVRRLVDVCLGRLTGKHDRVMRARHRDGMSSRGPDFGLIDVFRLDKGETPRGDAEAADNSEDGAGARSP